MPATGSLVTLVAALRAASAAPFAAWPACPPTAPTTAPKTAPALATPCCTQFPNASKKPCGSEGAGVLVGADDGASGPPVCAVAAMQANTKALNANRRAPQLRCIVARAIAPVPASSQFSSRFGSSRAGPPAATLPSSASAASGGWVRSGNVRQIAFKLEQVDCGNNAREEDRDARRKPEAKAPLYDLAGDVPVAAEQECDKVE